MSEGLRISYICGVPAGGPDLPVEWSVQVATVSDIFAIWRGGCPPDQSCLLLPLRSHCRFCFSRATGSVSKKGLHRCLSETPAALVRALLVIDREPRIEVKLQRLDGVVDLLAEGDAVELAQQRLVEPLTAPVSLRALHLGPGVIDILDGEVELILMPVVGAAIFGAAIGQYPVTPQFMLVEEGDHPVVENIRGCQRRLACGSASNVNPHRSLKLTIEEGRFR